MYNAFDELSSKINEENKGYIKDCKDINDLQKLYDWQDEYDYYEWETFRDNFYKCHRCLSYDDTQCICYAR